MNSCVLLLPLAALCAGRKAFMLVNVYRSGVVAPPLYRGPEARLFRLADEARPSGRQDRTDAIFASPSLAGVAPWFHFNAEMQNRDPFVREITVDSDSVFVYSVSAWDATCRDNTSYESYWESGITLTEYQTADDSNLRNPSEWELLLGTSDVQAIRDVSDEEFLEASRNTYEFHADLAVSLRASRRNLIWA
jgi:hypothetical protein